MPGLAFEECRAERLRISKRRNIEQGIYCVHVHSKKLSTFLSTTHIIMQNFMMILVLPIDEPNLSFLSFTDTGTEECTLQGLAYGEICRWKDVSCYGSNMPFKQLTI